MKLTMMRAHQGALLAVVLTLTACGGGGGEEATPGGGGGGGGKQLPDFGSEAGVQRELVLVSSLAQTGLDGQADARGQAKRAAVHQKAMTESCSGGGQITFDEGQRDETFTYFDTTAQVNFSEVIAEDCRQASGGFTSRVDGVSVTGETADGRLFFAEFGTASAPLSTSFSDSASGDDFDLSLLGRFETASSGSMEQTRLLADVSFEGTVEGERQDRVDFRFGEGDTPFSADLDLGTNAETLSGSFSYSSAACEGALSLETLAPLTYADGALFPSSGELRLISGSESATYTFNGNSVSYTTSAGLSGTVTEAELEALDPDC